MATPRIPVHHAQELPIGGKLPSYFILKSLTQSFPLEWRDVLRYQRLRKLHADLHAANCAPLRDPFGADPARLLGRGLSRQQVMARAARHRESDAASRRAYVWADVATRFGGTSLPPLDPPGCSDRRNCNVNLDDLDWDRPDLDCEPQQARGIPRNLQLDETVMGWAVMEVCGHGVVAMDGVNVVKPPGYSAGKGIWE